MGNIRLIVTDLDNTLLRRDKSISEYTRCVLNRCCQSDIALAFATARPERAVRHLLEGLPVSHVIADNGAAVVSSGIRIKSIPISDNTKRGLIPRLASNRAIARITVEVGHCLYTNDKGHAEWSAGALWNPVVTDFAAPVEEKVTKISAECGDRELLQRIVSEYPDIYLLPNSGENWYQIVDRSASKFNAVRYVAGRCGIALEDIAAFGDDYNDVEMLRECGFGVAMGNAVDEAKRVARAVCGTNEQDGVAHYLEQYIGRGAT